MPEGAAYTAEALLDVLLSVPSGTEVVVGLGASGGTFAGRLTSARMVGGRLVLSGVTESEDITERPQPSMPVLHCNYCQNPAITVRYGMAVCGEGDHVERTRALPHAMGVALADVTDRTGGRASAAAQLREVAP